MKSLLYIGLIYFYCLIFTNITNAQTISFNSLLHDYGIVYDHVESVEAHFVLTNTGDSPLIIHKVKPTCGCTTANYTKDSIMPGGRGYITVAFHPKGYSGFFTKTIQVISNSNVNPLSTLTIQGTVKKQNTDIENTYPYELDYIRCKNPSIQFSAVDYKTPVSDTIYVYNIQDTAVTLFFPHIPPAYKLEVYPQNMLLPNSHGIIIVYFDPQIRQQWGNFYDKIYIAFEGRENHYRQRIQISGHIYEDFSKYSKKQLKQAARLEFNNQKFTFDTVMQNTIVTHTFTFKNTGKSTLYIRNVKTGCGCTAGELSKKEYAKGEEGTLHVTFNTQGKSNFVYQEITITSNDPKQPNQTILIQGFVKTPLEEIKKQ